jgi:hypothetical protein
MLLPLQVTRSPPSFRMTHVPPVLLIVRSTLHSSVNIVQLRCKPGAVLEFPFLRTLQRSISATVPCHFTSGRCYGAVHWQQPIRHRNFSAAAPYRRPQWATVAGACDILSQPNLPSPFECCPIMTVTVLSHDPDWCGSTSLPMQSDATCAILLWGDGAAAAAERASSSSYFASLLVACATK